MSKFYTFMAAAMMATAIPASAAVSEVAKENPLQVELSPLTLTQRHDNPEVEAIRPMRAPEGWNPITERPAGESKQYLRSTLTYQMYYGIILFTNPLPGTLSEWVYGDDGAVYVSNPIGGAATNTWMKGEMQGDKIVFPLPQAIFSQEGSDGTIYYCDLSILRYVSTGDYSYEWQTEGVPTEWVIKINEDGTMESDMEENLVLAMTYADDGSFAGYGSTDDKYSDFNFTKNELPEGVELEPWAFVYDNSGFICNVGIDGDNVYLMDYYTQIEGLDAPIIGKIEGDKVVFPSRQYLGVVRDYVIFFFGGEITTDAEGNQVGILDENYTFDYDPETRTLTSPNPEKLFVLNTNPDYMQYITYYTAPTLKYQPSQNIAVTPVNPIPTYFAPYEDAYGFGFFYYDLPLMSVNDDVLSPDLYFYNIFVDDEPYAIDVYNEDGEFEEEVYDVPFTMSWDGMYYNGTISHNWTYSFTGFDTLGLQSFYIGGGEKHYSQKMTMNCETGEYWYSKPDETVKVESIQSASVVSNEYFDMTGRRVLNPAKGQILIKKAVMSDGSVMSSKVIIR